MSKESRIRQASTIAFLYAHGITVMPQVLDSMVREAISRLPRTLYRQDPRADLTKAESEALERGGFNLDAEDMGPEDPLVRTAVDFAAFLKAGLTTAQAAARLKVDPSRIRQRLTSDPPTLYGIRVESGWVIPEFQFDGDRLVPGMADIVARLTPELHPMSVFRWFTTPSPDLAAEDLDDRALSPRDWLRSGYPVQTVADLAADL